MCVCVCVCVCVCKVDFWPCHAQASVSHLPSGNNRLCHVHITSPALWLRKPRSVNYSHTHTHTHTHTHKESSPEALHKATMSRVQDYMFLLSPSSPHTSSISVTDGQQPLLACGFQAAKQMCSWHRNGGKWNRILMVQLEKISFTTLRTWSPVCMLTSRGLLSNWCFFSCLLKHILQAGVVSLTYSAWFIFFIKYLE